MKSDLDTSGNIKHKCASLGLSSINTCHRYVMLYLLYIRTRISRRRDTSPKFHRDNSGISIDEEPILRGLVCRKRRSSANTIGQFSVERASLNRYLAMRAPAKHVLRNVQAVEIEPGRME